MTYIPTYDFGLYRPRYRAPSGDLVDFNFGAGEDPGPAYPLPPDFMVWSGHGITLTSGHPSATKRLHYSLTPAQRQVRDVLRAAKAANEFDRQASGGWDKVPIKDPASETGRQSWDGSISARDGQAAGGWDTVPVKDQSPDQGAQGWDQSASPKGARDLQPYVVPALKDATDQLGHADSDKYWEWPKVERFEGYIPSADFNLTTAPYVVPSATSTDFNLTPKINFIEVVVPTRPVFTGRISQGWYTNNPADIRYRHPWDTQARKGTETDWDYDAEPNPPPKPPPEQPEIKEAYYYMNSSSLKKMPEGTPLEFADLSINLDLDSFSWSMTCRILNAASMALIRPGAAGPVEVEAIVNGKIWRFMIERYTLDRKFPAETYRVSGSSLTQLLAGPYSDKVSAQIETPTNALQVIQALLDLTAFEVDWDASLADYTIPAGVWGYEQKTPIEVIDELVKAAGGVIIPSMDDTRLTAKHRYADGAPWNWGSLHEELLDFIIVDSTISSLSSQWQPGTAYNGVYVSGLSAGVAVSVLKTGTTGDTPAADVYDNLNLTTQQCRGRGISILGQSGDQEIVTVEIPIPTSGAPGLVLPGQWGEIRDTKAPTNSWRGLVLSTGVRVSKPGAAKAVQVIQLERHHYA